jgi:hypothetical protein
MRLAPSILMLASILIAGCAGHSAECITGVAHPDCAPGTAGHEASALQQETEKTFAAMDDARCRAFGYEPGSQAFADCRRRASANQ